MTTSDMAMAWMGGYANVLLLAIQSRNATAGRYTRCAVTSFLIAICQVFAVRIVVLADAMTAAGIIGTSGSLGILTAIFVNTRIMGHRKV